MALIEHNVSLPNDNLGDDLREAFVNQNAMNEELYSDKVDKIDGKGLSDENFTIEEKTKLENLNENGEQNVQSDWNQIDDTADDFIKNKPSMDQFVSVYGFINYADLTTQATPIELTPIVEFNITNDGTGPDSNFDNKPYGVDNVYNVLTNRFDFSELAIGDIVKIRFISTITPTVINQSGRFRLILGEGTDSEYSLYGEFNKKSVGVFDKTVNFDFYIDDDNIRTTPARLTLSTDDAASLTVKGYFIEIIRRNVNITTIVLDQSQIGNYLVNVADYTIESNEVIYEAGTAARINGNLITSGIVTTIEVPFASSAKKRIDCITINNTGQLLITYGIEVDEIGFAVKPTIPLNSVLVTQLDVNDGVFEPVQPSLLTQNQLDAINGAIGPSASNPFITLSEMPVIGASSLSDVLMVGDREVVFSDGDGETILDVPHVGKIIDNSYNADDFLLPLSLFPIGSVLKIYNNGDVDLYCIPSDEQFDIIINDGSYNESAPVKLKGQATAILTKIDESPFLNEIWKLTYEFSEEALPTRYSLNIQNTDNTSDVDKPVSTAQSLADASVLATAKLYADNESAKGSVFAVFNNDDELSGQITFPVIGDGGVPSTYTTFDGQSYLQIGRTDKKLNGIYIANSSGVWQRRSDMRDGIVINNSSFYVQALDYAGSTFGIGQNNTVGTSNLSFSLIKVPTKFPDLVNLDAFSILNSENKYENMSITWARIKAKLATDLFLDFTSSGQTQLDNLLRDKTGIKRSFEIAPSSTYEPPGWPSSNFVTQGSYSKSGESGVGFKTSATAGEVVFKRRPLALNMKGNTGIFWEKIKFDSAVTDARFVHCLTSDFYFVAPTNVSPTSLLNIVGVCKLSTSQNIHVFHNDASGVATTIDLGVSFPANNIGGNKLYLIGLEAKTSSYVVHVHQLDLSTWELNGTSVVTEVSTDIPNRLTNDLRLTTFITNNTTAAVASYVDYHVLANNIK